MSQGFLGKKISSTRYRVFNTPEEFKNLASLRESLETNRVSSLTDDDIRESAIGTSPVHGDEFVLEGHSFIYFNVQIETKKVPGKLLKSKLAKREKESLRLLQENAPPDATIPSKLPKALRENLKQEVKETLLKKILPQEKSVAVLFNAKTHDLFLEGTSVSVADKVVLFLKQVFPSLDCNIVMSGSLLVKESDLSDDDSSLLEELIDMNPVDLIVPHQMLKEDA
jgi:DNA recombination-dependent growth factor C